MQSPPALTEGHRSKIGTIEPQNVKGYVGRPARPPEQVIELRAAGLISRNDLPIKNGIVDIELARQLASESIKPV